MCHVHQCSCRPGKAGRWEKVSERRSDEGKETTNEGGILEALRGERSKVCAALGEGARHEGGEGESSDEGGHRYKFLKGCFASVWCSGDM